MATKWNSIHDADGTGAKTKAYVAQINVVYRAIVVWNVRTLY